MWAIAKQTFKAAVRYRFVIAMAISLLIIVFGLPLMIKSDGTAKGMVQLVLTYTLGATTALLGISSLWMGCGTLAREIEDNVIQMVAVKPIARWQIWFGKWMGIMLLNAALLVPTGLTIYFLIESRSRSEELSQSEQDKLRNEVLVSRSEVNLPELDLTLNRSRAYNYCKLVLMGKSQYTPSEQALRMSVTNPEHILSLRGQDYVSLVEQAQKNPQLIKDVEELEHQAIQMYKGTTEVILPGQNYQWVFQIDTNKIDEINKRPIYLRYKFNAGDEYDPKSHLCTWTVGAGTGKHWPANEQPKQIKVGSSVFHELELNLEGGIVPNQEGPNHGRVVVNFFNLNEKPIIFLNKDGPSILYHDGGVGLNLFRGLLIIYFWLGLIAAIGLMASSFLAFPVAAFMSIGILLISASTGTLEQIVEEKGISGIDHETGRKLAPSALDDIAIVMAESILWVTNSVWDYSPVDNLSSGRTITWTSLFWAFIGIILFMSGLISAFGSLMFTRKELALPNPTASMN